MHWGSRGFVLEAPETGGFYAEEKHGWLFVRRRCSQHHACSPGGGRWETGVGIHRQKARTCGPGTRKEASGLMMLLRGLVGGGCCAFPMGAQIWKLRGAPWQHLETFLLVTALERATSDIWRVKVRVAVKHLTTHRMGPAASSTALPCPEGQQCRGGQSLLQACVFLPSRSGAVRSNRGHRQMTTVECFFHGRLCPAASAEALVRLPHTALHRGMKDGIWMWARCPVLRLRSTSLDSQGWTGY